MGDLENLGFEPTSLRDLEVEAIQEGEVHREGTHKDAYESPILPIMVKPMQREEFSEEAHRELTGTELVAPAEVNHRDMTDIGLWPETTVITQEEAHQTVEEAVEEYGTDEVVERTVTKLLDSFTERGIVYGDPGSNIGFFDGEPKAFDVYDESAFEFYDSRPEEMSEAEFHRFRQEAPTMYQKFACDVARYSGEDQHEVAGKVAESSEYLDTGLEDITGFKDAFSYQR